MAKFGNKKMYGVVESFDFVERIKNLKKYGRNTNNNKKWNKDVRRTIKNGNVDGIKLKDVQCEYREIDEIALAS